MDAGMRAYRPADQSRVVALVNADHLPGQPEVGPDMLRHAMAGHSPVDQGWWDELANLRTDVLVTAGGTIQGVISYAYRARDAAGVILWAHGQENPEILGELMQHALRQLPQARRWEAFAFATALGLGMEALPVRHRPVTDRTLRATGFTPADLWRYMHRRLPAGGLPQATAVETNSPTDHTRQLTIQEGGHEHAQATVGLPTHGIGGLWWISVAPHARGRGLGRGLLGSALDLLAGLGAAEVILYVDDDDPDPNSDRNRAAANQLYEQAGFTEIDRLCSYSLESPGT